MDLTRHCELCDHQKIDLIQGTTCGLTDKKPSFNTTCIKIELHEKFETKLKDSNVKYQKLIGEKPITYLYFVVFLFIGLSVILGGFLLGKYALDKGVISTTPIIIMSVGLLPLGLAFGALNNHRNELKIVENRKRKIDEVLHLYRIEYSIGIQFGKKYHGVQEVYTDLKLKGVR
ncbi:hypothetical protein [Flavobacterium sp. J27]|uniref:hypothetical protein n=1 Tax=Flavobacterium sp. J27 TaxID=2060419 RepID=UPI001031C31C|nr:hypothetical protein [Flavobacterium sp. J27]